MVERNEIELKLQEANRKQLLQGKIDRREFISRSMVTGLGMAGLGLQQNTELDLLMLQRAVH
jgi:hypothetical protein